MNSNPFLTPGVISQIQALNKRAFDTALALQNPPRVITLDRAGTAIPPQAVLVVWFNREPGRTFAPGTNVQGIEGQIQRWETLDAKVNDRFILDGATAEITTPVRVVDGVAQADFTLVRGR